LRAFENDLALRSARNGGDTPLKARFAVSVELESQRDGSLELHVRSMEGRMRMNAEPSVVVVTMWDEGDGTVRARLRDVASGTTSYIQGNETMIQLGNALGLSLTQ
jgi:hypothetical protein